MMGGDRDRLAEAEAEELGRLGGQNVIVRLVRAHRDRLDGLSQQCGDIIVGGQRTGLNVNDEYDRIRFRQCLIDLFGDRVGERTGELFAEQAAGVDDREMLSAPFGGRVVPVSRRAWLATDDGLPASDQTIEQSRLADVWAPNNGNRRQDIARERPHIDLREIVRRFATHCLLPPPPTVPRPATRRLRAPAVPLARVAGWHSG